MTRVLLMAAYVIEPFVVCCQKDPIDVV